MRIFPPAAAALLAALTLTFSSCTREGLQEGDGADGDGLPEPVAARITAGVTAVGGSSSAGTSGTAASPADGTALQYGTTDGSADASAKSSAWSAGAGTKADGNLWEADQIGIVVTNPTVGDMAAYLNVGYATDATDATTATFTAVDPDEAILFKQSGDITFAAYAPWDGGSASALPDTDGVFSCDTETQMTAASQEALDWLWATATGSHESPEVNFAFTHVMARLTVKIVGSGTLAATDIQGGAYTLGGISHTGTFNALTGATAVTGDPVADWSLPDNCVETDSEDGVTYTALILPQTPASLPFYAKIGYYTVTGYDLLDGLTGGSFAPGRSYDFTITVTPHDVASASLKVRRL